jgi:ParB family chromosome partitioning protein
MEIQTIEISRIVEDADQPRRHYDAEGMQGLADSIRQHGVLQPITVTPLANVNMFKIVTGERRWRASQAAGLDEMPCIVRDVDPEEVMTQQLIENIQREDLQPLDKAQALNYVKGRLGATNREVASRLGMSERAIGYLLDLLELPEEIGQVVVSSPNRPAAGQVTEKHARFLKQLNDSPELQTAVVDKIRSDKLSTDDAGKLVKALKKQPDRAEEILASPTDHLVQFFRDLGPGGEAEGDDHLAAAGASISAHAQRVVNFLPTLNGIHPTGMPQPEVRQVLDSLTSLKLAVDGLIRECKLELGETV